LFTFRFIWVDVGVNGRNSDAGIWKDCPLRVALEDGSLHLPAPTALPWSESHMPYHIVGDEAFPLTTSMMKPYPRGEGILSHDRLVFNYRLSRCRRIVGQLFAHNLSAW